MAERLAALELAMEELEADLREAEAVSSILEYESVPSERPGSTASRSRLGSEKSEELAFKPKSFGVERLAAEAGEELQRWREQREAEYAEEGRRREERLKELVASRRREEEDREAVRSVVRRQLVGHASRLLKGGVVQGGAGARNAATISAESVGAGAEALNQLQVRLEAAIAPVEASRPKPPQEMTKALAISAAALQRKRARVQVSAQRSRFNELTGHLDVELLEEAQANSAARRSALQAQANRQTSLLQILQAALVEREEAYEDFEAASRTGPAELPARLWRCLSPPGDSNGSPPSVVGAPPPSEVLAAEERQMLEKGGAKVEALLEEFRSAHLRGNPSYQAQEVEDNLQAWRLEAKQEVLDELCDYTEAYHRETLGALRASLLSSGRGSFEQLSLAVSAAEEFHTKRSDAFAAQQGLADEILARRCRKRFEDIAQQRRAFELCALKRSSDFRSHVDSALADASVSRLLELGEAAQQLASECRAALPALPALPAEVSPEVKALPVAQQWRCRDTPVTERLALLSQVAAALPDSAETCAVIRGLLCVVDEELARVCERLRSRTRSSAVSGAGGAD